MKKTNLLLLLISFLFFAANGNAQDTIARKKYFTKKLNGEITLDGIPNDDAWNGVEWAGDFTQWRPNEGKHGT